MELRCIVFRALVWSAIPICTYGYMNRTEIHVTWLEKYGPCDFQYDTLQDMFIDVTHKQNWDSFVGLAMTTISKEMFEAECPNAKAT